MSLSAVNVATRTQIHVTLDKGRYVLGHGSCSGFVDSSALPRGQDVFDNRIWITTGTGNKISRGKLSSRDGEERRRNHVNKVFLDRYSSLIQ
jgi:hypothetical protein